MARPRILYRFLANTFVGLCVVLVGLFMYSVHRDLSLVLGPPKEGQVYLTDQWFEYSVKVLLAYIGAAVMVLYLTRPKGGSAH